MTRIPVSFKERNFTLDFDIMFVLVFNHFQLFNPLEIEEDVVEEFE